MNRVVSRLERRDNTRTTTSTRTANTTNDAPERHPGQCTQERLAGRVAPVTAESATVVPAPTAMTGRSDRATADAA